jgi:hypothetical protein
MEKPRGGVHQLPKGMDVGPWLSNFEAWLSEFCSVAKPDIVIIEMAIASGEVEVMKPISINGVAQMVAYRVGARCETIANSSVMKFWLGSARIPKEERKTRSICSANMRGWRNVTDHNLADSLGLLCFYLNRERIKTPWQNDPLPGPLFGGKAGVTITRANELAANRIVNKALSFDAPKEIS